MKKDNIFGKRVIKNFFTEQEILKISSEVEKMILEQDQIEYIWKYFETSTKRIKRIEYFVNYNSFFAELSNSNKIKNEVEKLLEGEVVLFKDKINFKYKGSENFKPHQDISAGWGNYSDYQATFAIPLCDMSIENGAILFGSKKYEKLTDNFKDLPEDTPLNNPEEMKSGDIVIFDSYIPHASYQNNADNVRTILFFTYNLKSQGSHYEAYHKDKFEAVPPDISKVRGKKYKSGNSNEEEKIY